MAKPDGRYSTPPTGETLDASTERLKTVLDRMDPAASQPPSGSETAFFAALKERLKAGQKAYGDRSFSREPGELLKELEEECLDISGWAFVMFVRVRALQDAARKAGL